MHSAHIITDLQFGSTGKGAFAGKLAAHGIRPDTVLTAWGPNAGHTFIDANGNIAANHSVVRCVLIGTAIP